MEWLLVGSRHWDQRRVQGLAVFNGDLLIGGDFTTAGDISANYIVRWNATGGEHVGAGNGHGRTALRESA